jgi:hypothetical protein
VVVHAYNPSYSGGRGRRIASSRPLSTKNKRAGGMAQVIDYLPSMCKALGSIPSSNKKKNDVYKHISVNSNKNKLTTGPALRKQGVYHHTSTA